MLNRPKGYEYWIRTEDDIKIKATAPDWAKKEFEEYQKLTKKSVVPDEKGIIKHY